MKPFRSGFKDEKVFFKDIVHGMHFESKNAIVNTLYYCSYEEDLFVAKLLPDNSLTFGVVET